VNDTPVGSVAVSARVGVGVPVAATVNVPPIPAVNVAAAALVIVGAEPTSTVSVNAWVVELIVLVALISNVNGPISVGVPLSKPEDERVIPVGSVPVTEYVGAGDPVAVTWKELEILV
jgi:hypothetical protein